MKKAIIYFKNKEHLEKYIMYKFYNFKENHLFYNSEKKIIYSFACNAILYIEFEKD